MNKLGATLRGERRHFLHILAPKEPSFYLERLTKRESRFLTKPGKAKDCRNRRRRVGISPTIITLIYSGEKAKTEKAGGGKKGAFRNRTASKTPFLPTIVIVKGTGNYMGKKGNLWS